MRSRASRRVDSENVIRLVRSVSTSSPLFPRLCTALLALALLGVTRGERPAEVGELQRMTFAPVTDDGVALIACLTAVGPQVVAPWFAREVAPQEFCADGLTISPRGSAPLPCRRPHRAARSRRPRWVGVIELRI